MVYYLLLPKHIPLYVQKISAYKKKYLRAGNLQKSNVLAVRFT